jgi:hypothetical protein
MKNHIRFMSAVLMMVGALLSGCFSSASKVENAQDKVESAKADVTQANHELDQAIQDSIRQYRTASQTTLSHYDKSLAEFKAGLANDKRQGTEALEERWFELDQQNRAMQTKLKEYNASGQENWAEFKTEFSHDMDALGTSIADFFTTGKK